MTQLQAAPNGGAQVHVICNQKGGVGKTTLTINLAAVVANVLGPVGEDQAQVLVISTDPQGSVVWWADRLTDCPFDYDQCDDPRDLARLKTLKQYRHIFVDTPGSLEHEDILIATLESADDAVVPLQPEALSFDPTTRTVTTILEPRRVPYRVVVNDWDPRDGTTDLVDTQEFIDRKKWPRAHVAIRHYKLHTRASAEGLIVTQYPKNRVALEGREDFFRLALELGYGGSVSDRKVG